MGRQGVRTPPPSGKSLVAIGFHRNTGTDPLLEGGSCVPTFEVSSNFYFILYNNMCTHNTISSHTDNFKIQKMDSQNSLLTFINLFPSCSI